MVENKENLLSELALARQQFQDAQARVVELETQLVMDQPGFAAPQEREDRYHRTLDHMLEGCQIIGFDWQYLYVNETVIQQARRAKDELLGYTMMECYPGIETTDMFAVLNRCMQSRTSERIENKFTYPDGSVAWFELSIQPVPEGIFVLSLDITQRKQAENTLLQSEQRLRLFIEHTPAAIAMFDRNMNYLSVSWRWLADYHLGESDIVGRSHYEVFPDIPQRWRDIHQRCLNGAVEKSEADPFPRANGTLDWVRWEIYPWRDDQGEIGGIVLFSEVITARKQAEDHVQKLNRTLAMLSDINQAIVRIRDAPTLFEEVCHIAVERGGFYTAWIGVWDDDTGVVRPAAYAGIADEATRNLLRDLSDEKRRAGPTAAALQSGEHVIINDIAHDIRMAPWRDAVVRLGYRALAVFPFNMAGKTRGTLNLMATETDLFDAEELRMLDEIAGDIDFALKFAEQEEQRQQAEAALQRHAQRLELLHRIDQGIIQGHSIQELIHNTLTNLQPLIPFQHANVMVIDRADKEGRIFTAVPGQVAPETRMLLPPGWLEEFDADRPRIIPDLRKANPPSFAALNDRMASALHVLLMFQDEPIGWLILWADTPAFFTPEHAEIAAQITGQLAIAIYQTHLSETLERHAVLLEQRVNERTAELQAAKERVEAILDNSADGILLTRTDFTIEQTNVAFGRLFACQPDDYLNQPVSALFHTDTEAQILEKFQNSALQNIEVRARRHDGTFFDAELSIGLIVDDGLVCVIRDISERKAHERQLRYHASLQENVSDAVIVTDMEFRVQSWNRAAERIYGWRAEETTGAVIIDILHTQFSTAEDDASIMQQLQEQGWWQGEVIQNHKDGSVRYILSAVTLVKDKDGVPYSIVAINHDITERKLAEDALQKSAAEIHDLYNNAPCGYHSLDENGVIIQINDTELRWMGYERAEVVDKLKITDIFTPDSVAVFRKNFPGFKARGWVNDLEFDVIRKDGSTMHILLNGVAIYDEDGNYAKSRSTLFDITELRQVQQAIAESEARYRLLAENVMDVISKLDLAGIRTFVTPSCSTVLGYTPEELIGVSGFDFIHPDDRPRSQAIMMDAIRTSQSSYAFTHRVQHKNGHYLWVEVKGTIVYDPNSGLPLEAVAVTRDITERKQAEAALRQALAKEKELSDLKSRFVSMASHEFRTPLATILALTETLSAYRHKLSDEQIDQRFDKIKNQVGYLKDIMEDVLLLARMQARRVEYNPVQLDLDALCRSVLDEFQTHTIVTHSITYSCNAGLQNVVLDKKLMRQIINNLVSNAIKYSPANKPVIVNLEHNDATLILQVRDEGMGIPEADLPHLFEPFHRASNVGTIPGTGLGLVIIKESVELHHGTISVESQVDAGTTITVRIPLLSLGEGDNDADPDN